MATRVTLTPASSGPDASVEVAKTPLSNDHKDRTAEADWLRRAARPGVVPLVTSSPLESSTIVTEHVGSRTLRTARLDPLAGCRAMVEVAELLVELHRDGFVHGKLTPDHVIIGAERLWLCSPDGRADDPTDDVAGLARCMADLARQWEEAAKTVPFDREWTALAQRLADSSEPARSAARALAALRRLDTAPVDPEPNDRVRRRTDPVRSKTGLAFLGLFLVLAIGGLIGLDDDGDDGPDGPRVQIDDAIYAVGVRGDDVVVLDTPCDPTFPVVVLEASTNTVWAFDEIADGASPVPLAVVPGATDIRAHWTERDGPCTVAMASGPAGATIIDRAG